MYLYQPCGPQDPTYPLDRYIDPTDPTAGWVGLKPGHPERVVFAAITGVPLDTGNTGAIDWDHLLGAPGGNGPDDFCHRDTSALGQLTSSEGPISMQQANLDPNCPSRTVPACRRGDDPPYDPSHPPCQESEQYFAWPARRIVEVARRFDQAPLCNGAPCNNGLVASICGYDPTTAVEQIAAKIQSRLSAGCLPRALPKTTAPDGTETVACVVREYVPADQESACDPSVGRSDPAGASSTQVINGLTYHVCDLAQVPFTDAGPVDRNASGWYYNEHPTGGACAREITFLRNGPVTGAITRLACRQPGADAGVDGGR